MEKIMTDLFDLPTKAHARTDDPWTSHEAANSMSSEMLGNQQRAILDIMMDMKLPLAAEEIDNILGWPAFRRMSELKKKGLIEDANEIYIGKSGRKAIKYKLTTKGLACI
jgi:predicted ArsR family transcriptional regulator